LTEVTGNSEESVDRLEYARNFKWLFYDANICEDSIAEGRRIRDREKSGEDLSP